MTEESLKERARRVLMDNPDPDLLSADDDPGSRHGTAARDSETRPVGAAAGSLGRQRGGTAATAEPDSPPLAGTDDVELRLHAIRLVRDLGPKRACFAERVRDLSLSLVETSGDSIHYRGVLEKLREAHDEWLRLEEKLWAANYIIKSTQWLIDALSDPGVTHSESPPGHRK